MKHFRRARSGQRVQVLLICALLAMVTLTVYIPVGSCGFVNLDDPLYITTNSHVQDGLSWENARWAFTSMEVSNWHPVTWLSHMLDVQLFGVRAAPQHWMNLLLHILNSILLFLVLRSSTMAQGPSAVVAFLFAVHPLHVESVAWISERKDVLSTLFWFLATAAYLAFVRHPSVPRYLIVLLAFSLGLMTKPMLVTLPVTFLLLDYWPLDRVRKHDDPAGGIAWWKLFLEKVPLFTLSAISSLVTIHAQRAGHSLAPLEVLPMAARMENAVVSYARYLGAAIFPVDLAVFYPGPEKGWGLWPVVAASFLILTLSIVALALRTTRPYLAVGWCWFLITLLPVIGIVQVGLQAMADRYTYVPLIGIFIAAAWAAAALCDKMAVPKLWRVVASTAVLLPLALAARAQTQWWKDSITLLEHSLEVTRANSLVETNLAAALSEAGREAEALEHNLEALRLTPPHEAAPYFNVAVSLTKLGRFQEAVLQYRKALEFQSPPKIQGAIHSNLAVALINLGQPEEALAHCDAALPLIPEDAGLLVSKCMLLNMLHKPSEAVDLFPKAIALNPNSAPTYFGYGMTLESMGRLAEAVNQYRRALETEGNAKVHHDAALNLGNCLARLARPQEALSYYDAALAMAPDDPRTLVNKGQALAKLGRQSEAEVLFRRAANLRSNTPSPFSANPPALASPPPLP